MAKITAPTASAISSIFGVKVPEPTTSSSPEADDEIRALCGRGSILGACPQSSCHNCPDFCRA